MEKQLEQVEEQAVKKQSMKGRIADFIATLSREEAKEISRKGGLASAESRRRRKTFQEDLISMLSQPIPPTIRKKHGIEGSTWQQAVLLGALKAASKGNTKGLEVISALIGEKPKEELVIETKEKDGFDQAIDQLLNGNAESIESEEQTGD